MTQTKRNYGIDLLRLISMFYVVVLHVLGKGGILKAAEVGSAQYSVAWFMELWAYGAVNIFGIISGYVGFSEKEKKFNYGNYIIMWLQVVVIGVGAALVFYLKDPELVTRKELWKLCFPVTNDLYWYFSAYTGLIFLIPLLNAGVRSRSRESLAKTFIALCLVFALVSAFADRFELGRGYSLMWLIILYLLGAMMKKCRIGQNVSALAAFGGILACCVMAWLWRIYGPTFTVFDIKVTQSLPANYLAITSLIAAILHVIAFSKLRFPAFLQKFIAFAAPGAFTVYLLNNQMHIWRNVMTGNFAHLAEVPVAMMAARVLAFSLTFVAMSVLVDWVRQKVFSFLRVKQAAALLVSRLEAVMARYGQWLLG